MPLRPPRGLFALLRQGVTIGADYGLRSVEALLAVAQTIEESVYEPGSLHTVPGGLAFALDNPPLRVGAFARVRVLVDGEAISSERVRLRPGPGHAWRTAAEVTSESTYDLGPGDRTEFEVAFAPAIGPGRTRIRIEFEAPAIPPIVWCEIRDTLPPPGDAP